MIRQKGLALFCLVCLALSLGGCERYSGRAYYEIVYPSGYSRGHDTWAEPTPVEGTEYWLWRQEAAGDKTGREDALRLLDSDGRLLLEAPGLGSSTMRGEADRDGAVWVCSERWLNNHANGYMSSCLAESTLLLIDAESGEVLFCQELGENELYLTTRGTRCYFYDCGQEARTRFFGLYRVPRRPARLYYRDRENWAEAMPVQSFEYVEWPEALDDERSVENIIRFSLQAQAVEITMLTYEQTDKETNTWEYIEKSRCTVWLEEAGGPRSDGTGAGALPCGGCLYFRSRLAGGRKI